ncbi:hypothetical protein CC86DRAFT_56561 [Ophiobolus disseminans]|uniref:Uncharacterized protein n=1 Tax=Ophiobolus disseminans TaxID=1469910 RepID=A0A6A6ZVL7_9PLEO|nr:hypothetical protein CC86DRAFT_56561 [Ophiobolus disseminans]
MLMVFARDSRKDVRCQAEHSHPTARSCAVRKSYGGPQSLPQPPPNRPPLFNLTTFSILHDHRNFRRATSAQITSYLSRNKRILNVRLSSLTTALTPVSWKCSLLIHSEQRELKAANSKSFQGGLQRVPPKTSNTKRHCGLVASLTIAKTRMICRRDRENAHKIKEPSNPYNTN